ncbi:MAG: pitrilysin family protein [Polyangiales bacterium]
MPHVTDPQVETATLDNGLSVTTVALPHLHTSVCALFARAGARFERPEDNGLSHFVEHMLYRGTERHPTSLALQTAVEQLGSSLHAETGRDRSLFQLSLPPEELEVAVELLGELMGRPRFADLELERALVLAEVAEDYDEDGVEINVDDVARGALFGADPLGQRVLGPRANIERFTLDDVRRHFAAFYGARNLRLCVAGPVPHARVVDAARRSLAALPAGEAARVTAPARTVPGPTLRLVPDPGAQADLTVLFRAPGERDPAHVALLVLLRVLDGGMSSRLHYQLADQRGLAYSVHASVEPYEDVSLLAVTASAANAKAPAFVRELLAVLDGLREGRVTEAELATAKVRYRYEALASLDDAGAMAEWFGGAALDPAPSLSRRLEAVAAVSVDDVARAARGVFAPRGMAAAVVGALPKARLAELKRAVREWA